MDSKEPLVGIVMGSDSDWPLVQKACATRRIWAACWRQARCCP